MHLALIATMIAIINTSFSIQFQSATTVPCFIFFWIVIRIDVIAFSFTFFFVGLNRNLIRLVNLINPLILFFWRIIPQEEKKSQHKSFWVLKRYPFYATQNIDQSGVVTCASSSSITPLDEVSFLSQWSLYQTCCKRDLGTE